MVDPSGADAPPRASLADVEALDACWIAMAQAGTLDDIEAAALNGLLGLINVEIAYTARRKSAVWTISREFGLSGNIAGVAIPEEQVPYASDLCAGSTLCYETQGEMGPDLAAALEAVGLRSLYAVPIMKGDLCVGALAIGHHRAKIFDPRDRALVRLFTSHMSVLIANRDLVHSLEALAESVPDIVLRTDPSGWINWYNRRWYEFTGQTREEAAGWGWQTAHHPEVFQKVIVEWPKALATGQPIEIEVLLRRYDGVYEWFLARVAPVRDDTGTIISWYGSLANIQLQKQAHERTRRVAETLQEAFLPKTLPRRANVRIDALYVSAEKDALVGGDWYDAFELPDGRLCFYIGDVAGHGLEASVAVGNLRQSIFTLALRNDDPGAILADADWMLRLQEPGTFVTALVGFINREATVLTYATAGHPPPIFARTALEPAQFLATGGPPLGVAEGVAFETHTVPIERDAIVLLYTDGVTEVSRDALAGETALREVLPQLVGNASIARPATFVYENALGGAIPQDDAAILLLQFSTFDAQSTPVRDTSTPKHWRFHASDAQAAHAARQLVGAYMLEMCGAAPETFMSELIVGELLANTVEHAPGLVDLSIAWTGAAFELIVVDNGPGLIAGVRKTLPDDPLQEGSRGLFLVHELATGVTITPSAAGGAELRVVLPLKRRP